MDPQRFDRLAVILSLAGTRRGVMQLLAALPFAGVLAELLAEDASAAGRRKRRKAKHRHQTGNNKQNRKGKRKGCTPSSDAKTCAGKCATVRNSCGKNVECGPCTCATGCPDCQTCNPATGLCVSVANNTPCDDVDACTQTDTCQNGVCVGSNPKVCPPPADVCRVQGTCDPTTGLCSSPQKVNGTVCGTSTHGGTTTRCCAGACPDPDCLASFTTGPQAIAPNGSPCTAAANCCSKNPVGIVEHNICWCTSSASGGPCGSDRDCQGALGCICGTCQAPPP